MCADRPNERSGSPNNTDDHSASGADELGLLFARVSGMVDHFLHWFEAHVDLARLRIRRVVLAVVVFMFAAVTALVVAGVSAVYLIRGGAGALAAWADAPYWFGQLAVGLLGLGGVLGAASYMSYRGRVKRLRAWVKKYEGRRAAQEARATREPEREARHAA